MTRSFTAQIDAWARKTEARMTHVLRQSAEDVIERASRAKPGVTRGGRVEKGVVPVDTGALAASLLSSLRGSTALSQSAGDYALVVGAMQAGDVASFVWTAPYARALHYGYTTSRGTRVGGWLWVDDAAAQWQSIVAANVARAKVILR